MLPIVYYFPLLWKTNTLCQDGLVVGDMQMSVGNQIRLLNLGVDYHNRMLCEEKCQTSNYNGFLNFAHTEADCSSTMRYFCRCQDSATSCRGDSVRLTGGTYGFLEIFGAEHHKSDKDHKYEYDHSKWFPVCAPSGSKAVEDRRNVGQVVCRNFGMDFESKYGTSLPVTSEYPPDASFFPWYITCTGGESSLRECTYVQADTTSRKSNSTRCRTGYAPLYIMCTSAGHDPDTTRHTVPQPPVSDPKTDTTTVLKPASFEMFEPTFGRWTPISELGWTPIENDAACRLNGRNDLFGANRMYSCKAYHDYYKTRGHEAPTGYYQIMADGVLMPIYCDMDYTDPGWNLIFNNTFDSYLNKTTTLEYNIFNHSLNSTYSILAYADDLTQRFPGRSYDLRIDVNDQVPDGGGGHFRLPKTESLISSRISRNIKILQLGSVENVFTNVQNAKAGFTLMVPHFSNWTEGNSVYGMNVNAKPASVYGNLISRSPVKEKYSFWTAGLGVDRPKFTSMWVREVPEEPPKDGESCMNNRYLFESRKFSKRQIYASSSTPNYEPWQSHIGGNGWMAGPDESRPPRDEAWSATSHNDHPWIMVDLLQVHIIKKLVIMGVELPPAPDVAEAIPACWPKKIDVFYRANWSVKEKKVDSLKYKFTNRDVDDPVHVVFEKPLVGRLIRVVVNQSSSEKGSVCLRWNLYGCPIGTPSTSQYLMSTTRKYNYFINKLSQKSSDPLTEAAYFKTHTCDFASVRVNLQKSVLLTGIVFAGNPHNTSTTKLNDVKVYASFDGRSESYLHVNGTVLSTNPDESLTTAFTMKMANEPLYVAVNGFGARQIRFQHNIGCSFRFELIGREVNDWCNAPLGIGRNDSTFQITVSSARNGTAEHPRDFYGIPQLSLDSRLLSVGYGAWVAADSDNSPNVKVDLKYLYTVTAIQISGMGTLTKWRRFNLSYALTADKWKLYGDLSKNWQFGNGRNKRVELVPAIVLARYIRIDLRGTELNLKFELFGCRVPFSRSDKIPGLNMLKGLRLTVNHTAMAIAKAEAEAKLKAEAAAAADPTGNATEPEPVAPVIIANVSDNVKKVFKFKSFRECFDEHNLYTPNNQSFLYDRIQGRCGGAQPLPNSTFVTGYERDPDFDLHWLVQNPNPEGWGVRPLISNLRCTSPYTFLEDCDYRHGHDDPAFPSSPIIPDCPVYCGDPGHSSDVRRTGRKFSYPADIVTYTCVYQQIKQPDPITATCGSDGRWSAEPLRCPRVADENLALNYPFQLSTYDPHLSWVAKSWPTGGKWQNKSLQCLSSMRSTYPYMLVDFHTPIAVENVTLDFGIGEDLANSNLNVLITNHKDPERAGNDMCFRQHDSKVLRNQNLTVKCAAQVVGRYMIVQFRGSDRVELYICAVSVQGSSSSPYENLAEYQTTKQISRLFQTQTPLPKANYFAFLAVDGNTSLAFDASKFEDSSCQASGVETSPWMVVDLGQESAVIGASLFLDKTLYEDADVLTIWVSNNDPTTDSDPICGKITTVSTFSTTPIPVRCTDGTIYGRYINVSLTTSTPKSLVICELQIWGRNCTDAIDRAIEKPVISSTTLGSSSSHHLVDYQPATVFSTDYETNPYIIVDLIGTYYLDYVELDLADSEIEGLNLSTSNSISLEEFKQTGPEVKLIEAGVTNFRMKISPPYNHARYVKIQARNITTSSVAIKLRALRVISRACYLNPKSGDVDYRNLAFNLAGNVNASAPDIIPDNVINNKPAGKNVTVDGIKNARPTMCFGTTKNPSWNVTLPKNASIYRVSIFGAFHTALRVDVRETMNESTSQFCGTLQSSDSGVMETSVVCDVRSPQDQPLGLNGQIVTIQPMVSSDSATILLCEVEVWGIMPDRQDIIAKKKEDERIASLPPSPDPDTDLSLDPSPDPNPDPSPAPPVDPPTPSPPATPGFSPPTPSPSAPPVDPPAPDPPAPAPDPPAPSPSAPPVDPPAPDPPAPAPDPPAPSPPAPPVDPPAPDPPAPAPDSPAPSPPAPPVDPPAPDPPAPSPPAPPVDPSAPDPPAPAPAPPIDPPAGP